MAEDHFNPSFPREGEADVSCECTGKLAHSLAEHRLACRHMRTHMEEMRRLAGSPSQGCSFFQLVLCEEILEEFIHRPGDGR